MNKPSLQLRIGQQLSMTPQLQQAIRLLQMPAMELQAQVQQALESNVMLEREDEDGQLGSPDNLSETGRLEVPERRERDSDPEQPTVEMSDDWHEPTAVESEAPWSGGADQRLLDLPDESGQTLQDHLAWQLRLARLPQRAEMIGAAIVDAINDDGYLTESLGEIADTLLPEVAATAEEIEGVLVVVQQFDPPGVGARGVAECIALQLRLLEPATPGLACALALAGKHLELVAEQQYSVLLRHMHCGQEELDVALALVRGCHPRPGSAIQPRQTEFVVPDAYVRRSPNGWTVELNPSTTPRLRINEGYAGALTRGDDHAVLRTQLQEARWLLRSLEIRNETMLRVARCIVERQVAFLDHGEEAMVPLILKDIAVAIEMHESTVSRVATGKYLHTPRGVFEFRYFFSSQIAGEDGDGVSSTAIRAKIRKLISQEDPDDPLSDSRIAELLSGDGVQVARRTVAKYREALGLPSSTERRRIAAR